MSYLILALTEFGPEILVEESRYFKNQWANAMYQWVF
jgi:hypothetical protein